MITRVMCNGDVESRLKVYIMYMYMYVGVLACGCTCFSYLHVYVLNTCSGFSGQRC